MLPSNNGKETYRSLQYWNSTTDRYSFQSAYFSTCRTVVEITCRCPFAIPHPPCEGAPRSPILQKAFYIGWREQRERYCLSKHLYSNVYETVVHFIPEREHERKQRRKSTSSANILSRCIWNGRFCLKFWHIISLPGSNYINRNRHHYN